MKARIRSAMEAAVTAAGAKDCRGSPYNELLSRELLGRNAGEKFAVNSGEIKISPRPRLRTAMLVAIAADVLEMIVFPLFVEGFESPVEDLLDIGVGAVLSYLLGWHWEFAPSFLAKLVPGVDLIPLWTMAVANVYRKSRPPGPVTIEGARVEHQAGAVHPEQTRGS